MSKIVALKDSASGLKKALEQRKAQINTFLAGKLPTDNFIQVALVAVLKNTDLLKCDPTSVIGAIYQGAQLGLSFDPLLKEAYIVPYKGKAQCIVGYKGLENICIREGITQDMRSRNVYEKDEFEWHEGDAPRLVHRPYLGEDPGKLMCSYCVAVLADGRVRFRVIPKWEADKYHRNRSMAKDSGPWLSDTPAMYAKTATRVMAGELPRARQNPVIRQALSLDEVEPGSVEEVPLDALMESAEGMPSAGESEMDKLAGELAGQAAAAPPEQAPPEGTGQAK